MIKYFYLLLAISIIACSKDSDNGDGNNPDTQNITAKEPCFTGEFSFDLPSSLADPNNYILYEATAELVSTVMASEALLSSLSTYFLSIPASAAIANVDGVNVTASDNALQWTDGEETFIYIENSDGYSVRYLENADDVLASELINVSQNEDCTSFRYNQYAIEDDGDIQQGDLQFYINYDKAGTADILEYGTALEDEDSETIRIRKFEDSSGSMRIKNKKTGQDNRVYLWNTDGSGSWEIYENGVVIDEGNWSF